MPTSHDATTVSIRPGVSILSVLRHLNYRPWFALAEFVDNAIQSAACRADDLKRVHGRTFRLRVEIELNGTEGGTIRVADNAAGISAADYPRAFRPAEIPHDRSGLSEFGMGMKSAACWFAPRWTVRTKALGESVERTVDFNIDEIVRDDIKELSVGSRPASAGAHFTEITLRDLFKTPQGNTVKKIRDHLASIYRVFLRRNELEIVFDRSPLTYAEPRVLVAPFHENLSGPSVEWRKEIDFDFGRGLHARGFAAIRETASTSGAGFALFRRDRLIEGSADEGYRPEFVFGKPNSYRYQRIFGELHLEGFDVSHTKDGFQWDEQEDTFLAILCEHLAADPIPLLEQADHHRILGSKRDLKRGAEKAAWRTAEVIRREVPPILEHQFSEPPDAAPLVESLLETTSASTREIDLDLRGAPWRIVLELTADPSVGDWIDVSDKVGTVPGARRSDPVRRVVTVRVALAHPFMERFGGVSHDEIEPLLRVAAAIALSEITARESGVRMAGTLRRNINELLRGALSRP